MIPPAHGNDLFELDRIASDEPEDPAAYRHYNRANLGCWMRFHIWFSNLPLGTRRFYKAMMVGLIVVVLLSIIIMAAHKPPQRSVLSCFSHKES
jgi:hypothetical protein